MLVDSFIITEILNKINKERRYILEKQKKYGRSYSKFENLLNQKGITAYRVAIDLGFSPMILSDWKNDKSKPKLDTMILISNYLSVPVTDFSDLKE